jgi:p-aminobenzoyl-glutamate transporter AbgT
MHNQKINHLAVWLVVLLAQVLPALWYGIFVEPWMRLNDLTQEFIEANQSMVPFIVSIFSAIILAYMISWIYLRMRIQSVRDGLLTAFIVGFPVTILDLLTIQLFSHQPYELAWIDGGINLIIWLVAGSILGGWTRFSENK